jgi:hypothetical protein
MLGRFMSEWSAPENNEESAVKQANSALLPVSSRLFGTSSPVLKTLLPNRADALSARLLQRFGND